MVPWVGFGAWGMDGAGEGCDGGSIRALTCPRLSTATAKPSESFSWQLQQSLGISQGGREPHLSNSALTEVEGAGRAGSPKGLSNGLFNCVCNQLLMGISSLHTQPWSLPAAALLCCSDALVLAAPQSARWVLSWLWELGEKRRSWLELMLAGTAVVGEG